jgi:hypothetical protein
MEIMKRVLLLLFATSLPLAAKDELRVQVIAVHAVTHDDQSARSIVDKGLMGATIPTRQVDSFNLDTVINNEHVLLACEDSKGCESPALATYDAELKRGKWVKLTFPLPLSKKSVTRWYRIAGSW